MKHSLFLLILLFITQLSICQQTDNAELGTYDKVDQKCNFKTIEKLKSQGNTLTEGVILEFLMAIDVSCKNNVEWSEASNETLFRLAEYHTKELINCLKANKSKLDTALILEEFKHPIHDGIDLKAIYTKLQKLNDNDKIVKDILTSLSLALNN